MALRDYQLALLDRVAAAIAAGNSRVLVEAPLRAGQTVIGAALARQEGERGRRVLFAAHRREIVAQTVAKLFDAGFDLLLTHGCRKREIANVPLAYKHGPDTREIEHCPHCGGVVRDRRLVTTRARAAIPAWFDEVSPS